MPTFVTDGLGHSCSGVLGHAVALEDGDAEAHLCMCVSFYGHVYDICIFVSCRSSGGRGGSSTPMHACVYA